MLWMSKWKLGEVTLPKDSGLGTANFGFKPRFPLTPVREAGSSDLYRFLNNSNDRILSNVSRKSPGVRAWSWICRL